MTAIGDAAANFHPDHILIALRSAEHADRQERGLIEKVEQRFGLPMTTSSSAEGPVVDRSARRRLLGPHEG